MLNRFGIMPLFFLTLVLGPLVAFAGHVVVCHDFDVASRVMTCSTGDKVPQLWLYAAIASSVIPFILLVAKLSSKPEQVVPELGENAADVSQNNRAE